PDSYNVIFTEGRVEIRRTDKYFTLHTEVIVSPEDDIELRRTKIVNRSSVRKTIEITSYAEVVLAPSSADAMHPAFSNLFVQTEIDQQRHALLCTRRPRSENDSTPWMFHLITTHGVDVHEISFETDRSQFLGRGNTVANPAVMQSGAKLSNSQGSVLDPIVAIRYQFSIDAGQSASFDIVTGMSESRAACLELIDKYRDRHLADRVLELSWTHNQVMLRQLNISDSDAQLYSRLANSFVYVNPHLRADATILLRNHRGQSGLWSSAISGDLPIVLVQIKNQENFELIRQLVQAHCYWRSKGLAVDLVIWNEEHNGYRQVIQESIQRLISSVTGTNTTDKVGGIFVRMVDQLSDEDRILFQSVARIFLSDSRGSLAQQINRRELNETKIARLQVVRSLPVIDDAKRNEEVAENRDNLLFSNGYGGFSNDGREYIITTNTTNMTPAPWVNVIANAQFGTVISESGQSYTWGENAHEFRLTPWENDPVSDPSGEAFYIRDEETGQYWSPTPLPCHGVGNYQTQHGFGYSIFSHTENEIETTLTVFVALNAALKFSVLRIHNRSNRIRKISATAYIEWVLGDLRPKSAMHIVTELDLATQALCARNPYNIEFQQRAAFLHVNTPNRTFTADRNEFIGRNRSLRNPAALDRQRLSGKLGAGLDPCAALHVPIDLLPGETKELVFTLGLAQGRQSDVSELLKQYQGIEAANAELVAVKSYWQKTLTAVQIDTPDHSLNILANGWLLYQTLACRLWARSGYYQSGGAFGFRDQLQDSMALVHSAPDLVRAHLLLSAAHQFTEGDAQHWWHPPVGRGVRTHCSDDFLWLPLAVCRYVNYVGDLSILDEQINFIDGRALNKDEDSYYDLPIRSQESATLYQHCVRAIKKGLHFGEHGLALIGSCDWNDGMDKVGNEGRGESVWLSFFLIEVLNRFAEICNLRQDVAFQEICVVEARNLQRNIESNAWDGEWYRRAYFDDGTPLGSSQNTECQIDSISQSWAVLSGAGEPHHTTLAMQALEKKLVQYDQGIIKLLEPPFDHGDHNPGYIRGYVPGVRENGGQYTHAAIWTAMAFAKMKDTHRTYQLINLINPGKHGDSPASIAKYKVEPYVIAADVYAVAPHTGRGGWTWYTGSAGWMQRLIIESLLGVSVQGNQLIINPCVPKDWDRYSVSYRFKSSTYLITVIQLIGEEESTHLSLDGSILENGVITMVDDELRHEVEWKITRRSI
ncbi:MAG: cyclic beta 1-2 glucan synthetase, partial [Burkholderiaceae bacterium]|nr:cyclic beta 1-2 glucan synthetase [Burkholderiaceae bacterium]